MSRDVSFDSLGRLLSIEHEAERARLQALAEGMSLQQRAEQGLSFLDLESVEEEVGLGGRVLVTLARKDKARFPARLDNRGQVAVFPRRSEVKEPARALVSRATATRVQLAFDREPPPFVHEGLLRLDRVPNDVTYERVRAGLQRVKALDKGTARRKREVLLDNEPPASTPSERSPFIAGSKCVEKARTMILNALMDEFARYAAVIRDPNTPVVGLEVIVNDSRAVALFEQLLKHFSIPGEVVVRP